jgi:hypothetical protein
MPDVGIIDLLIDKVDSGNVTIDAVGTLSGNAQNGTITIKNI